MRRSGFTLLEVVIALAILTVSLFVLIDSQASAVIITNESNATLTGSYLAQQKMTEALLRLEKEGFGSTDVESEGDFKTFTEDMGMDGMDVDFGDEFDDYHWAYAIRKVDIQLGDVAGATDQLTAAGIGPSAEDQEASQEASGMGGRDMGDLVQPDQISEMLAPYIREVRVVVWWGAKEPDTDATCEDCVELITHVANPSGFVVAM